MFVVPTAWELASLVCKLLLYFGTASIAGGSLSLRLYNDGSRKSVNSLLLYIMAGALLGFQGVLANFFIQVGLINDSGLSGMFDWSMASLLLGAQLGDVTIFRLAGFVLVILSTLFYLRKAQHLIQPPSQAFFGALLILHGVVLIAIAFSFTLAGHVSVLGVVPRFAIIVHTLAFSVWIGALIPLLLLTASTDLDLLQRLLKRFGDHAIAVLLALAGAGVLMLLSLLETPGQLLSSAYGLALLVKLIMVALIVGIAGLNKLVFVPAILRQGHAASLRNSIRVEILVATLILMLTAYLSTIVGPPGH
ncbi:MAG: CopD family protein [Proteobacteria bacterium]|nr:CopD family protein [Pseudomonadota bacterium]